jgi:hypothetical protein
MPNLSSVRLLNAHTGSLRRKRPLDSTQDLITRFQLLPIYDKYVRPHTHPSSPDHDPTKTEPQSTFNASASTPAPAQTPRTPGPGPAAGFSFGNVANAPTPTSGGVDKGKGKEVVTPGSGMNAPTPGTAAAAVDDGDDGEEDAGTGKGEKKQKNSYRSLIKGIPGTSVSYFFGFFFSPFISGLISSLSSTSCFFSLFYRPCGWYWMLASISTTGKHSMRKDDYLQTMMLVPPKQKITIQKFDTRTQREAFSVSLEGLKAVSFAF